MALCCAGAACCNLMCAPARALGIASKNYAKMGYVMFQILWIIITVIMMFAMRHVIDYT